jgi:hypothetical protein
MIDRAFSPYGVLASIPGRCPRLGWRRAVGAGKISRVFAVIFIIVSAQIKAKIRVKIKSPPVSSTALKLPPCR